MEYSALKLFLLQFAQVSVKAMMSGSSVETRILSSSNLYFRLLQFVYKNDIWLFLMILVLVDCPFISPPSSWLLSLLSSLPRSLIWRLLLTPISWLLSSPPVWLFSSPLSWFWLLSLFLFWLFSSHLSWLQSSPLSWGFSSPITWFFLSVLSCLLLSLSFLLSVMSESPFLVCALFEDIGCEMTLCPEKLGWFVE